MDNLFSIYKSIVHIDFKLPEIVHDVYCTIVL